MKHLLQYMFLVIFILSMVACDDDDKVLKPSSEEGKILVATAIPNADGMSGIAFMQLIDNLEPKEITNSTAMPISYYSAPCVIGNDIFIVPGWGGSNNVLKKYSRINGKLVKQGEYTLPENAAASNVVTKGDIAYISCAFLGKIIVINHKTMKLVKEIDITSYGVGDQNPDPSAMLIRDNHLFVGLTQMVGGFLPAPERVACDVIIINTENNQVMKMITDSTSGLSTPTRPIDPNSIFMDENKDIYISCLGSWGFLPGHKAGLLRIKAGETEFDPNYKFILNSTAIEGETNPLDHLLAVKYFGNNKMYATANIPAYYSNPRNFLEDRTVTPVEIDLVSKTIKKLDFPYSTSYSYSVGKVEDKVVFGLATEKANGCFVYNPTTGKASESAVIKTEGLPNFIASFE